MTKLVSRQVDKSQVTGNAYTKTHEKNLNFAISNAEAMKLYHISGSRDMRAYHFELPEEGKMVASAR